MASGILTKGSRKTAVARVRLLTGKGDIFVNKKPIEQYFSTQILINTVKQPLRTIEQLDKYTINISVKGGGVTGQAEAARHGIARALCELEPTHRIAMKQGAGLNMLTRDSRKVERKKPGQPKARKKFTFVKR